MRKSSLGALVILPAALLAISCSNESLAPASAPTEATASQGTATTSYVIDLVGSTASATLASDVAAAGGSLTQSLDGLGLAIAESDDPGFAARAATIARWTMNGHLFKHACLVPPVRRQAASASF